MQENVFQSTISIIVNGVYPNIPFKRINDAILILSKIGDNQDNVLLDENDRKHIDEIVGIIVSGIYPNHTFGAVNNLLLKLQNYGSNVE